MQEYNTRTAFIQTLETRRRFLSDSQYKFDSEIANKLLGHWHIGRCDYEAAGVSQNDFNTYRRNRDRLLDYHNFCFYYINYDIGSNHSKWLELCKKYNINDIEWQPKSKRDTGGMTRRAIQNAIIEFLKVHFETGQQTKKKPLLKLLREKYTDINPSSLNRQFNNLIKYRVLEIDTTFKTKKYIKAGAYFKDWSK